MDQEVIIRRTRRTPLYSIGVASRLCGISIHTLRWVERAGLVAPSRTEGNQRLFCDEDMDLLVEVRNLLAQRVNLSGIRIILRMQAGDGKKEKGRE
ncbi:MAG: MerR family transcriptional regulator [Elusimicrobia bacterium]|jgi:MerR family glutamine synthetase transcriptional repressor|nr:MerR family transcriptional regulator [Elusimicrobiota bacterium]